MAGLRQAYADYSDMMELAEALVAGSAEHVHGKTVVDYQGEQVDLTPPWRRVAMRELVREGEAGAGGSGGTRVRQDGGGRRGGHDVRDLPGPVGEAGQGEFVVISKVVTRSHLDSFF